MSGQFRQTESDWVCADPSCGNINFSRRSRCNKCGKDKSTEKMTKKGGTEIGKHMAEKSKGLFSADDWQCKTCGNVNWARRSTCNVCNAPKFGKVESRTGFGGGFMERDEVVEYKNTSHDDGSEYDEFGRKKKQFRGQQVLTKSIIQEAPDDEEEEDDDDDDEDGDVSKYKLDSDEDEGDDADLSKYDLSGSESDSSRKKNKSKSRSSSSSSSSSSRSRSRSSRSRSSSRPRSKSGTKRSRSRSRSQSPRRHRRSRSGSRSRSRSDSRQHGGRSRHRSRSKDRDNRR